MANELPPITNPFKTTAPNFAPEPYVPETGDKGTKAISILFIVFGIVGLLTLPGLLIGTAAQLMMPQFQNVPAAGPVNPAVKVAPNESLSESSEPDNNGKVDQVPVSKIEIDPATELRTKMQSIQEFNPVAFGVGIANFILSGFLLYCGIGLSKRRRSAARLGITVCKLCSVFEVARIILGAWTSFQAVKIFQNFEPEGVPDTVPLGAIMMGGLIIGFIVSVIYAIAKIVMYVMCARHLSREDVQSRLT